MNGESLDIMISETLNMNNLRQSDHGEFSTDVATEPLICMGTGTRS